MNINDLPTINSTCCFQVVNEPADVHFPVVEMSTRSKLSCLSWNKCTKSHIASSDYEGIVTVWDVNTRQVVAIIYFKFLELVDYLHYLVIFLFFNRLFSF